MRCPICNSTNTRPIKGPYHYIECGLDYVYLKGVPYLHCKDCRDNIVAIPREQELLGLIAKHITLSQRHLVPDEIRFLRALVGWSQAKLAKELAVTRLTVTRWESGAQTPRIQADVLLRLVWLQEYTSQIRADTSGAMPKGVLAQFDAVRDRLRSTIAAIKKCPAPPKSVARMTIDVKRDLVAA
ncbi:MAG: helix-turn-helix domain-containing protein [Candidatus Eisenbacteria sp.]|nr:helix-turn-helix domain-containing protein [Candidatus Eisenbacteria bacterium]